MFKSKTTNYQSHSLLNRSGLIFAVKMYFLLYQLFPFLLLPLSILTQEATDVKIFHSTPITSKATLDDFLQFGKENETHAIAYITYCPLIDGMMYGKSPHFCDYNGKTWRFIIERLAPRTDDYYKAVFMIMDVDTATEMITGEESSQLLQWNNFESVWFGIPLVYGPNADSSYRESDGRFLTFPPLGGNQKIAQMFIETKLNPLQTNNGYSREQLEKLKKIYLPGVSYIAFDATYLDSTPPALLLELLIAGDRVIIYQIQDQRMPDYGRLRNIVVQIKAKVRTLQLYLDRKIVDRLLSYVPTLDWTQIATQRYREKYLNPLAFYDHLAQGDAFPFTHMHVWTSGQVHYLSERSTTREDRTIQVPLNWLLIQLNPRYCATPYCILF